MQVVVVVNVPGIKKEQILMRDALIAVNNRMLARQEISMNEGNKRQRNGERKVTSIQNVNGAISARGGRETK